MRKRLLLVCLLCSLIMLSLIGCSSDSSCMSNLGKSNLGNIGNLSVKRSVDTSRTYGINVNADGVLGATQYYLYNSKTNDQGTATIIYANTTNQLSMSLDRYTTHGTYYFWYRASDGANFTGFSNVESLKF